MSQTSQWDWDVKDLPLLALDRQSIHLLSTELMMAARFLREAREQRGRKAHSEAEISAREHESREQLAATPPPVRPMSQPETAAFAPESESVVTGRAGTLNVRVGPCGERGRWGVSARLVPHATGSAAAGEDSSNREVLGLDLSVVDADGARAVAKELIKAGANREALSSFAEEVTQRVASHAAAAAMVRETQPQWRARIATAIEQAWPAELAQAVVGDQTFGALAFELHRLENRGYTLSDILARIDHRNLMGEGVFNPCGLAKWYVTHLNTPVVVDGEVITTPTPTPKRTSTAKSGQRVPRTRDSANSNLGSTEATVSGPVDSVDHPFAVAWAAELVITDQSGSAEMLQRTMRLSEAEASVLIDQLEKRGVLGPAKGSLAREVLFIPSELPDLLESLRAAYDPRLNFPPRGPEGVSPAWWQARLDEIVVPALRQTLPEPLFQKLSKDEGYKGLLNILGRHAHRGLSLAELLRRLPIKKIEDANNSLQYLKAVVDSRAQLAEPRANIDQEEMRQLVRGAFPGDIAENVIYCRAWPALATRLHAAQRDTMPVETMLAEISTETIDQARAPAAFLCDQIRERAASSPVDPVPRVDPRAVAWAAELVVTKQFGSAKMLKREMQISEVEASVLLDELEKRGVLGPPKGPLARDVLVTRPELPGLLDGLRAGTDPTRDAPPRGPEGLSPAWWQARLEEIVVPALRAALPEPLLQQLSTNKTGYQQLLNNLAHRAETGWSLPQLLHKLPISQIEHAKTSSVGYLNAVVNRRAEQSGGPPREGVDQDKMRQLVRDAFPDHIAAKVIDCRAWPALAARLHAAQRVDMPVESMLAGISTEIIDRARMPAAFVCHQILERARYRQRHGDEPDITTPQPQPGRPVTGPARVLDRLDHTLTSDMTEAAAHRHAADQADSLAGVEERAASHEHAVASVSVFSGEQAEASEHEGLARVDDNLAAGAEATAAEERGMAAWAVSRAGVVFTPMRASELITSGRHTTRRPVPRSAPAWRMTNTENRNRSR